MSECYFVSFLTSRSRSGLEFLSSLCGKGKNPNPKWIEKKRNILGCVVSDVTLLLWFMSHNSTPEERKKENEGLTPSQYETAGASGKLVSLFCVGAPAGVSCLR